MSFDNLYGPAPRRAVSTNFDNPEGRFDNPKGRKSHAEHPSVASNLSTSSKTSSGKKSSPQRGTEATSGLVDGPPTSNHSSVRPPKPKNVLSKEPAPAHRHEVNIRHPYPSLDRILSEAPGEQRFRYYAAGGTSPPRPVGSFRSLHAWVGSPEYMLTAEEDRHESYYRIARTETMRVEKAAAEYKVKKKSTFAAASSSSEGYTGERPASSTAKTKQATNRHSNKRRRESASWSDTSLYDVSSSRASSSSASTKQPLLPTAEVESKSEASTLILAGDVNESAKADAQAPIPEHSSSPAPVRINEMQEGCEPNTPKANAGEGEWEKYGQKVDGFQTPTSAPRYEQNIPQVFEAKEPVFENVDGQSQPLKELGGESSNKESAHKESSSDGHDSSLQPELEDALLLGPSSNASTGGSGEDGGQEETDVLPTTHKPGWIGRLKREITQCLIIFTLLLLLLLFVRHEWKSPTAFSPPPLPTPMTSTTTDLGNASTTTISTAKDPKLLNVLLQSAPTPNVPSTMTTGQLAFHLTHVVVLYRQLLGLLSPQQHSQSATELCHHQEHSTTKIGEQHLKLDNLQTAIQDLTITTSTTTREDIYYQSPRTLNQLRNVLFLALGDLSIHGEAEGKIAGGDMNREINELVMMGCMAVSYWEIET